MELELKRPESLKVKLDGVVYELTKPKLGEIIEFEEGAKQKGPAFMAKFLVARGLPEEIVLQLEGELIEQIADALTPKKKG